MPNVTCPTCRFAFPLAAPAVRVECPQCFESFNPAAAPKPAATRSRPNKADAPIPLAEMVEEDDIPIAKPVAATPAAARPVAKVVAPPPSAAAKPAKPPKPTPQERKTVGTPRVTRRDDDDDDEPRRPAARSGWKMIAAGVVGLVVVVGGAMGVVYAVREKPPEVAAAPAPTPAPAPVEQPPPVEPKKTPPVENAMPAAPGVVPPPFVGGPPPGFPVPNGPPVERPFGGGRFNPPGFPAPAPDQPKPAPVVVVPPAEVVEIKPTAAAEGAVVNLPAAFDRVCVGGGGRFLIFRLPSAKQIAVFDVNLGKIAKYLPLAEEGGHIAAGMTKLFVLAPNNNILQRWNLLNFEKELTVPSPAGGNPTGLLMGHQTDGPLFVVGASQFVDARTMKSLGMPAGNLGHRAMGEVWPATAAPSVRVSADGRVYAWWSVNTSPTGLSCMVLGDDGVKAKYEHTTVGAITPGPDGTLFTGGGLYTPELKKIGGNQHYQYWHTSPVPAVHGSFYLSPTGVDWDSGSRTAPRTPSLVLRMLGHDSPLCTLQKLNGLTLKASEPGPTRATPLTDRLFLIPDAKLLVVAGDDSRSLHLNAFDPKALMEAAGIDYLMVASRPHPAVAGKSYRYVPDVWSKKGGVKLKLDAGPDGMQVIGNSVTWKVPPGQTAAVDVILTVSDAAGQEVFHNFRLTVNEK